MTPSPNFVAGHPNWWRWKEVFGDYGPVKSKILVWTSPDGKDVKGDLCFNYTEDLNAMHKVEELLPEQQRGLYIWFLTSRAFLVNGETTPYNAWRSITATAAQRAEELLRILDLWKD